MPDFRPSNPCPVVHTVIVMATFAQISLRNPPTRGNSKKTERTHLIPRKQKTTLRKRTHRRPHRTHPGADRTHLGGERTHRTERPSAPFLSVFICVHLWPFCPFIGGAMTPVPRTTKNTKRTWISINRSESKRYEEIMTRGRLSAVASTGGQKPFTR